MKRLIRFLGDIPEEFIVRKREFLLTIAVSALAGMVIGMLCSPRKSQQFGCNNGNHSGNVSADGEDEEV